MCQAQEVLRNSGKTTAWQTEKEAGVTTFALVQRHELKTDTHSLDAYTNGELPTPGPTQH